MLRRAHHRRAAVHGSSSSPFAYSGLPTSIVLGKRKESTLSNPTTIHRSSSARRRLMQVLTAAAIVVPVMVSGGAAEASSYNTPPQCAEGTTHNPQTNQCETKKINRIGRAACPDGQQRNPETKQCEEVNTYEQPESPDGCGDEPSADEYCYVDDSHDPDDDNDDYDNDDHDDD